MAKDERTSSGAFSLQEIMNRLCLRSTMIVLKKTDLCLTITMNLCGLASETGWKNEKLRKLQGIYMV